MCALRLVVVDNFACGRRCIFFGDYEGGCTYRASNPEDVGALRGHSADTSAGIKTVKSTIENASISDGATSLQQ